MLDALREPIEVGGRELVVGASLGLVFVDDLHEPGAEVMLRSGEMAMFSAKGRGKGRIAVFERTMHEGAFERLELKTDLAYALERSELLLHYQPIVDLRSGRITSFEALMRWRHPKRGMVSPGSFIPLAEETGLIVEMGRWLLEESLGQLHRWHALFPSAEPFGMSVNLSARQLEDDRIVSDIARAVAGAGVPASAVTIELTESVLVDGSGPPRERLQAITQLGVHLVADDFGAGYASYAALQQMPFSGLKLDMSLIEGLADPQADSRGMVHVRSLIEMAATTGLSVVAEGVECAEQVAILADLGCRRAQGFYFARPDAPERIEELVRANLGRTAAVA
jgi:EAL domain-containing protein (putative c-di-GMP-specific phosphodiesterase class I)